MFDFTEDFTLKGKWWIPADGKDEDQGIYGELSYSKSGGISLTVEGSLFGSAHVHVSRHNERIPLVYGVIKYMHHVSLFNLIAFETGEETYLQTECSVEYTLYSEHGYFATEKMEITGINFSTNIFNAFLKNVRKFLSLGKYEEGKKHFEYTEVEPIPIINNETEAYFYCSYKFRGFGRNESEFVFSDRVYLNIHFQKNRIPVENADSKIRFFKDFFAFFSYPSVCFHRANVFTRDDEGVKVEFSFLSKENNVINQQGTTGDILLFYEELEKEFSTLYQFWLDNETALNSGLSLYLHTKTGKSELVIQNFLNLVFALETLHNTYFNKPVFSEEELKEFKQKKKTAFQQFNEKHRKKLNECISHFNSLSFSERLKDLIEGNKDLLHEFIYDVNDFCTRVKKQRNFLAHNHSESKNSAIDNEDYYYFIAVLKLVFECSFLKLIGLTDEQLKLSTRRNHTYQYFKNKVPVLRNKLIKKPK
jgi:hypothetical protein